MNEEEFRKLKEEQENLVNNSEKTAYSDTIPNPQADFLAQHQADEYIRSLMGEPEVKVDENGLHRGKVLQKKLPTNKAFTDAWFLGLLVLIIEPLLFLLTYLILR